MNRRKREAWLRFHMATFGFALDLMCYQFDKAITEMKKAAEATRKFGEAYKRLQQAE